MQKIVPPRINLFGLCENAWLPWQPSMQFSRVGCIYKINHILAATYHRLLNLVPNKRLDICLSFHGQMQMI